MALRNLLVKGSYSKIRSIFIDNKEKFLRVILDIYKDENQNQLITSMDYNITLGTLAGKDDLTVEEVVQYQKQFDKLFSPEVLEAKGNTLHKAIYEFLKTREEMSKVKNG